MENIIYPIAITKPDWQLYTKACQDCLGISPLKVLDSAGIDAGKPAAFFATLDFTENPISFLRSKIPDIAFWQFHVSFILLSSLTILLEFYKVPYLMIKHVQSSRRDGYFAYLDGPIDAWRNVAIGCTREHTQDYRIIVNKIYIVLEAAGFYDIFSGYSKCMQDDGTFILVPA